MRQWDNGTVMFERARGNPTWVWLALVILGLSGALIALPLSSALALIGGALGALALLRWHELALYLAIVAVPFGTWLPIPLGVGNLTAVDLAVALLLALWFARMSVVERGITIRFPPLTFPFALFLFAALVSLTGARSLPFALKELTKWVEMFALYVYVANNLDATKLKRALAVMLVAGSAEAAIGIYQFLFRWGPKGFLLFGDYIRAFGTFEQPNPFAGYLALILPIALGVVLGPLFQVQSFRLFLRRTLNLQLEILTLAFAALALVTMLVAALMSWSRGAWLGIAAGLLVTVIVQNRRAFIVTILAAFVVTFIVLLSSSNLIPDVIAARLAGIADYFGVFDVRGVKVDDANYAVVERMAHWQAAGEMLLAQPAFGVGIGNYAVVYPAFALPRWDDPLGHAHNYYLNVAAETGLVGLGAYLLLWGAAFGQGWRAVRGARGEWQSIAAGLLGMLVALSAHNLFDNLFVHGMAAQVGIGLGMLAVINDKLKTTQDKLGSYRH